MTHQQDRNGVWQRAKLAVWVLVTLLALYIAVCWSILNVVITPRRITNTITPDQIGLPNTQRLTLENPDDGALLQAWLVPSEGRRAVVLLHGIHSQAWDGTLLELTHAYKSIGIDVLLFDLRGHGWSGGTHVGLGLQERNDVGIVIKELLARGYESGTIGLHGLSYGAAVALLAGAQITEVGGVIADTSFADAQEVIAGEIARETNVYSSVAAILLPGIAFVGRLIYSIDLFASVPEKAIPKIAPRPVLLIHGTDDTVIPFSHARRLHAAGGSNVELWPLPGRKHAEGIRLEPGYPEWSPTRELYLRKVTEFFSRTL